MTTRVKLWVGIGACVLMSGQATASDGAPPFEPADTAASPLIVAGGEGGEASYGGEGAEGGEHSHGGEGGEYGAGGEGGEGGEGASYGPFSHFGVQGGEGGEGGEAAASQHPGVFYANLLLMNGHLWVGRELYTSGQTELGSKHLNHPGKELFPAVEGALGERGVNDFKAALDELHAAVEQEADWSRVEPRFEAVQAVIDDAIATIDPELRENPEFLADVLLAVAKTAGAEYDVAVKDERFVNTLEYQDGRGFMLVGKQLLAEHEPLFMEADPAATQQMVEVWNSMLDAWPSVMPPESPEMTPSQVYAGASRFEFAANRL